MKTKAYFYGMKLGLFFANSVLYAFFAGFIRTAHWYSDAVETNAKNNSRLEEWKKRGGQ